MERGGARISRLPDLIIAVDPGGTCGFVSWSNGEVQVSGEIAPYALLDWVDHVATTPPWTSLHILIVAEKWRVTNKTARYSEQLDAPYVIGTLMWIAHRNANVTFETQHVAKDGKSSPCPDRTLRALGWYKRTGGGHQNDAHRHLYIALIRHGWSPPPDVLAKILGE